MAGRTLNVTSAYEAPHLDSGFVYVSRTTGKHDPDAMPRLGSGYEFDRIAIQIANLRGNRLPVRSTASEIAAGMRDHAVGDYFVVHGNPNQQDRLLGYTWRRPYEALGHVVVFEELVTAPGMTAEQAKEVIGSLMLDALSDPEIAPKAAVRFRSPNPSGRGVGVMESLGTEQVYLGLGGINRRDFYGQVNSIMPNLEFLGYNVHPHPWA